MRVAITTAATMPGTKIRRSKVGNMPTERLLARREFLRALTGPVGARTFEMRLDWAWKVAELVTVNRELVRRGVLGAHDLCPIFLR